MNKSLVILKFIVFITVLIFSLKSNAQVHRDKTPLTIDYFTYDKIVEPTNLKIKYSCSYDKTKKVFINAPDGNWSNTTTSESLSLVNPKTKKPYKARINGGVFEITSDNDFNEIKKVNSLRFRGWNGKSYKLVVSDFLK